VGATPPSITASPVALQIAKEHGIDLALIKPSGGRVEKADVLAYLNSAPPPVVQPGEAGRGVPASPKARRLAAERGIDLTTLAGSGPEGAVLAADIPSATPIPSSSPVPQGRDQDVSTVWRVMAERMTASWTTVPHFYLLREVAAEALVEMRARITPPVERRTGIKPTYTDLLVKMVAAVLPEHPRVNASWIEGGIRLNPEVHVGLATAIEEGLIVPVIHNANRLSIGEIAAQRQDLVARANAGKLKPADIFGGTFTLTNLGMYNVDAFNAIVNTPQAAILAVGRIADRVVAVNGQPAVRPMLTLALSCDHRVVDGARAAQFLDDLARLIQEPWAMLA
jgi:pyruvate dehydrogenase E2 component (dihydrolipoamide acetyltransferase)